MTDFISVPFYDLFHENGHVTKIRRNLPPLLDGEAWRSRFLYRITEGDKVISEEEITGYSFRPPWDVLQRELAAAGFTQAEGAEGLLAWRLA